MGRKILALSRPVRIRRSFAAQTGPFLTKRQDNPGQIGQLFKIV